MFVSWFGKEIYLKLIYRSSRDGWSAGNFHKKCDNQESTIVVIKSEFGNIFGGYTSATWDKYGKWKSDENSFLFSITYG